MVIFRPRTFDSQVININRNFAKNVEMTNIRSCFIFALVRRKHQTQKRRLRCQAAGGKGPGGLFTQDRGCPQAGLKEVPFTGALVSGLPLC